MVHGGSLSPEESLTNTAIHAPDLFRTTWQRRAMIRLPSTNCSFPSIGFSAAFRILLTREPVASSSSRKMSSTESSKSSSRSSWAFGSIGTIVGWFLLAWSPIETTLRTKRSFVIHRQRLLQKTETDH